MTAKAAIPEEGRTRRVLLGANAVLASLALLKLLAHLLTAGNYGYFRDELYYIAASEKLALGYVDFPPFVALVTAFVRATLGDSLLALRLLPALAGATVVVLTLVFGQHTPEMQVALAPHALPHAPQFCSSSNRFLQTPEQHASPARVLHALKHVPQLLLSL